jgi:hypothetical protein
MWQEVVLTLIVLGNNWRVKMASNMSLYLGNSFSNKLFHKVFSRLANPPDSNTYTMEQHNHQIHEHIINKHFTSKTCKEKTQSSSSSKF